MTNASPKRKAGGWKWVRVAVVALFASSCAQIMSFQHSVADGACVSDQDCAPDKLCLLDHCGLRCSQDSDCALLNRCLKTTRGNACIDSRSGCDPSCPTGTLCADDHVCRTVCQSSADCLTGQYCPAAFCTGKDDKHDPPPVDGGPQGSGGTSSRDGGTGGTAGAGGAQEGGTVDSGPIDAGPPLFADCDGNGSKETTLGTVDNCGSCKDACTVTNGTGACVRHACQVASCSTGFADCDKDFHTGCEADLTSDSTCGACKNSCVAPTGGSAACTAGACKITACPAGFDDCDGVYATGCEQRLNTVQDCGKCNNPCSVANGRASCATGACEIACACTPIEPGDLVLDAGVDASLGSGPGPTSPPPEAGLLDGGACTPGSCAEQACQNGFGDCDGDATTGCETDITTSITNCGACQKLCSFPHASEDCVAGTCKFLKCDAGWANCDGNTANGCETDLRGVPKPGDPTTILHCGACLTNCNFPGGTPLCVASGTPPFVCQLNSCATNKYTTPDTGTCGCTIISPKPPAAAPSCSAAGAVSVAAASSQSFTANLPDGASDWYHFSLPGVNADRAARERVKTSLTVTQGFLMEVKDTSCAVGATINVCPGETSNDPTAVIAWDWFDDCAGTSNDLGDTEAYHCNNLVGGAGYLAAPTELFVRVYSQGTPMCASYNLKIERTTF